MENATLDYEMVLFGGYPCIMGEPGGDIEPTPCMGLNIDDKVRKIGRKTKAGGYSSSCREHVITPYMTYKGIFMHGETKYLAFLLPDGGVNWGLFDTPKPVYGLFVAVELEGEEPEIILQDFKRAVPLIFKAVFEKVTN